MQKAMILPKQVAPASRERPWVRLHKVPEAADWNRLFVASPIEKVRNRADLKAKQRAKRLPSSVLGAVDVNDDGVVDGVELKLSSYLRNFLGDSHELTPRGAYNMRVKEGKKKMLRDFINQHGFDQVKLFAPQLCGDSLASTIEKLSTRSCFKDDYRYLQTKAARHTSQNGTAAKELTRPYKNAQRSALLSARKNRLAHEKALFSSAAQNVSTRVDKSHLFRKKYEGVGSFRQQTEEILKNSFFRAAPRRKHRNTSTI